jgi:hypothetical protein
MTNEYINYLDKESQGYVEVKCDDFKWWLSDMVNNQVHHKLSNEAVNNPEVGMYAQALEPTVALRKTMDHLIPNIQFWQAGISKFQYCAITECGNDTLLLMKKTICTVGTKGMAKLNASEQLHFKVEIPEFAVKHEQGKQVMTGALSWFNNLFECINGKGRLVTKGRT